MSFFFVVLIFLNNRRFFDASRGAGARFALENCRRGGALLFYSTREFDASRRRALTADGAALFLFFLFGRNKSVIHIVRVFAPIIREDIQELEVFFFCCCCADERDEEQCAIFFGDFIDLRRRCFVFFLFVENLTWTFCDLGYWKTHSKSR